MNSVGEGVKFGVCLAEAKPMRNSFEGQDPRGGGAEHEVQRVQNEEHEALRPSPRQGWRGKDGAFQPQTERKLEGRWSSAGQVPHHFSSMLMTVIR